MFRNKFNKRNENLHSENYKNLLKNIKEDLNDRKEILYLWIGTPNILRYQFYSNGSTDSTQS